MKNRNIFCEGKNLKIFKFVNLKISTGTAQLCRQKQPLMYTQHFLKPALVTIGSVCCVYFALVLYSNALLPHINSTSQRELYWCSDYSASQIGDWFLQHLLQPIIIWFLSQLFVPCEVPHMVSYKHLATWLLFRRHWINVFWIEKHFYLTLRIRTNMSGEHTNYHL